MTLFNIASTHASVLFYLLNICQTLVVRVGNVFRGAVFAVRVLA